MHTPAPPPPDDSAPSRPRDPARRGGRARPSPSLVAAVLIALVVLVSIVVFLLVRGTLGEGPESAADVLLRTLPPGP